MRRQIKGELPDDAEVLRAGGEYICEICGLPFYDHPMYTYPGLTYGPIKGCDGGYYHL